MFVGCLVQALSAAQRHLSFVAGVTITRKIRKCYFMEMLFTYSLKTWKTRANEPEYNTLQTPSFAELEIIDSY